MEKDTDINGSIRYDTVAERCVTELTEKKSRFIATLDPVGSEEEATALLADMRGRYHDARHNCYAYVLGAKGETVRFSDDGEPSGTAGRPILDCILSKGLTNVMITVTRYFGGVLLGTGGLVRAYGGVSADVIDKADREGLIVTMRLMRELTLNTDYNLLSKVQYTLSSFDAVVRDTDYGENVSLDVLVSADTADTVMNKITDVTSGIITPVLGEAGYFALTKQSHKL